MASTMLKKVFAEDRLPKESGSFLSASKKGLLLKRTFDKIERSFVYLDFNGCKTKINDIEYWFEEVNLPLYSDDKDHNLKEFYQHLKKLVKDYEDQTGEKVSEIVLSGEGNNYFSFTSK